MLKIRLKYLSIFLVLISLLSFLNILRIKSKFEDLSTKLDYIENKLDK